MADEMNFISVMRDDAANAIILRMIVDGTTSELARFTIPSGLSLIVRLRGRKIVVTQGGNSTNEPTVMFAKSLAGGLLQNIELDALTEPGAYLLPPNAPLGTKVGLRTGSNVASWIDNFSAKALES